MGSLANAFQYAGRELDSETGLYYYRSRYYDPGSGRFLTEDPLRFGLGATVWVHHKKGGRQLIQVMTHGALQGHSADFYSYVSNSPLNNTDPRGLWQVNIGVGFEWGWYLTFGRNNGQWNIGLDVGAGLGAFVSFDPAEEDCECGFNAHAEGDLGIIGLESVGGSLNYNENGESSGSISLSDPSVGHQQWNWDPSDPTKPPQPTWGIGAGIFSGWGYTECF